MTKYQPLFELHQLVQLTHSTTGKAIFYSQVLLAADDNVDEDEAGGWILSAFTGKAYFEREYRRDDLEDLIAITGDANWTSFAKRFKRAILEGSFHIVDMSTRECRVIVDNDVHSRTGSSSSTLETIVIDMYPVNHASRGEKIGEFMFECARFIQAHGCSLRGGTSIPSESTSMNEAGAESTKAENGANTIGDDGKSLIDLKLERDNLKSENADLKREIDKLHAQLMKAGS
ncbi:hypothetical protein BX616_008455, partial [Lobosporangium transversale]